MAEALAGQEAVIHLAGYDDGVAPSDKDYIETNVLGAWNVFNAAEGAGVTKLVAASSSAMFGFGFDCRPDYLPVDEDHPLNCRGAYGHSKELIECMARQFVRRGHLKVVCLRPTLIVRPEKEAQILAQLALDEPDSDPPEGATGPGGVRPYGALSATRSYVSSRDTARAFCLALDYEGADYDVFNIAAADSIGREDTLKRLERIYGRLPEIRYPGLFAGRPSASVLDIRQARDRLGWAPQEDWAAIAGRHEGG